MTDAHGSSGPHDPTGPGGGASPGVSPAGATVPASGNVPKKKLPTGVKVLIGCLGTVAVVTILGIVALGVGGFALKRGVDSVVGGLEEQGEATETLARLERDHPFRPPENGVIPEASAERYASVTAEAWERMRPWAEELEELDAQREDGRQPGLRDAVGGVRAMGGFWRSRVELAQALEAQDMSLGEYVWTGLALQRAADVAAGRRADRAVPERNLALAREHEGALPATGSDEAGPGIVLALATVWARAELPDWRAPGLEEPPGR